MYRYRHRLLQRNKYRHRLSQSYRYIHYTDNRVIDTYTDSSNVINTYTDSQRGKDTEKKSIYFSEKYSPNTSNPAPYSLILF